MKKSLILSALLLTAPVYSLAADNFNGDKTQKLQSDSTVKKSDRKAILGISDLGLETNKFEFPVYYTPAGKNAKTILLGNWKATIDKSFLNNQLAENYLFLIPARFDKLIFNSNKAIVKTATKNVTVNVSTKPFKSSFESKEAFEKEVLNYLNTEIAPKLQKVLSAAKVARYNEMSDQEKETFISQKAKEVGIPADVLKRLINSAYVFSVYMSKLKGQIDIHQQVIKTSNGTVTRYNTSLNAPVNLYLLVFKYENGQFKKVKEINTAKTKGNMLEKMFSYISKNISGTEGITTPFKPTERDANDVLRKVIVSSFKDNMIALSTRLKKDRDFAVSAPVENVENNKITLNVGVQEDIRVDHPFKIYRNIDGEEKEIGWAKVRKSGKDCLLLPASERTPSEADMISGKAEVADLAVEEAWTGVFGSLNAEYRGSSFSEIYGQSVSGGEAMLVNLGFAGDLGYILNNEMLSEVWLNMYVGVGTASTDNLPDISYYYPDGDSGLVLNFALGAEKRFYVIDNAYIAPGISMDYEAQSYSYVDGWGDDATLGISTMSITPKVNAAYIFSPKMDVYASLGYNLPLSSTAALNDEDGNAIVDDIDVTKDGGIDFSLGINVHVDFAGPFTKMFKKPSAMCEALKRK